VAIQLKTAILNHPGQLSPFHTARWENRDRYVDKTGTFNGLDPFEITNKQWEHSNLIQTKVKLLFK